MGRAVGSRPPQHARVGGRRAQGAGDARNPDGRVAMPRALAVRCAALCRGGGGGGQDEGRQERRGCEAVVAHGFVDADVGVTSVHESGCAAEGAVEGRKQVQRTRIWSCQRDG